jgi:hypothetical protein
LIALRLQLRGGLFDVGHIELDPRLGHGEVGGPLVGANASELWELERRKRSVNSGCRCFGFD